MYGLIPTCGVLSAAAAENKIPYWAGLTAACVGAFVTGVKSAKRTPK